MGFEEWLEKTPGGRHCAAMLTALGVEAGLSLLELAFVAGQIDQARKDRLLIRDKCSPGRPARVSMK